MNVNFFTFLKFRAGKEDPFGMAKFPARAQEVESSDAEELRKDLE